MKTIILSILVLSFFLLSCGKKNAPVYKEENEKVSYITKYIYIYS